MERARYAAPTGGIDVLKDVLAIFCDLLEEWVDVTVSAHG
jgi:hypothetical protein